jgi:ribosomal protein S11
MAKVGKKSRKTRKIVSHVQAHITASFNNTIVSITDEK